MPDSSTTRAEALRTAIRALYSQESIAAEDTEGILDVLDRDAGLEENVSRNDPEISEHGRQLFGSLLVLIVLVDLVSHALE